MLYLIAKVSQVFFIIRVKLSFHIGLTFLYPYFLKIYIIEYCEIFSLVTIIHIDFFLLSLFFFIRLMIYFYFFFIIYSYFEQGISTMYDYLILQTISGFQSFSIICTQILYNVYCISFIISSIFYILYFPTINVNAWICSSKSDILTLK